MHSLASHNWHRAFPSLTHGQGTRVRVCPRAHAANHSSTRAPTTPCCGGSTGWGGENWQWWRVNLAKKMQGNWYSTVAAGQCTTPSAAAVMPRLSSDATATSSTASPARGNEAPRPPCYWQLRQKVRTIAAPCLLDRVRDAVIAHNRTCFSTCPQPTNISTTCFVECFMANVLGPDGGTRIITPSEGIPVSIIQSAWKGAFANVTAGGCPDTARH